jgi:hypothetical protein
MRAGTGQQAAAERPPAADAQPRNLPPRSAQAKHAPALVSSPARLKRPQALSQPHAQTQAQTQAQAQAQAHARANQRLNPQPRASPQKIQPHSAAASAALQGATDTTRSYAAFEQPISAYSNDAQVLPAVAAAGGVSPVQPTDTHVPEPIASGLPPQWPAGRLYDADVEEQANVHLQMVYSEQGAIPGLVQRMQALRQSSNPRECKVFDCIVHNLLDEYRFFPKYPEKELRITGVLFGDMIQNLLFPTTQSLQTALGYLCEALQQPPDDKMFTFGLCALEQAKWRIHEFPGHCTYIMQLSAVAKASPDTIETIQAALLGKDQSAGLWPKVPFSTGLTASPAPAPAPAGDTTWAGNARPAANSSPGVHAVASAPATSAGHLWNQPPLANSNTWQQF